MSPTIFVIDDDDDLRDAVSALLRSVGHATVCFSTGQAFLDEVHSGMRGCAIVDVRMPQMTGLQLQCALRGMGFGLPLVFLTGHGDLQMGIAAMKAGAFDFLSKPFCEQDLIEIVDAALAFERNGRAVRIAVENARLRQASLDPREAYVMDQVVAGSLNKTISASLGLSEITIKLIRRKVMDKMGARTLPDLVRIASLGKGG